MVRLNKKLKEAAMSQLPGDVLHNAGPTVDDDEGVVNNLRQRLTLAIHVSSSPALIDGRKLTNVQTTTVNISVLIVACF